MRGAMPQKVFHILPLDLPPQRAKMRELYAGKKQFSKT
jgi:hypothetical protein